MRLQTKTENNPESATNQEQKLSVDSAEMEAVWPKLLWSLSAMSRIPPHPRRAEKADDLRHAAIEAWQKAALILKLLNLSVEQNTRSANVNYNWY